MKRFIIIHYSEIGLKKANADYFIEKLRRHIKVKLEKKFRRTFCVKYTLGRILSDLPEDFDENEYANVIKKIFGIRNFKFVYAGVLDVEALGEQIWGKLPEFVFEEENKPSSFCVRVKRSMKLTMKSFEVAGEIGSILLEKGLNLKVKLKKPEFVVDIEFFNDEAYFSYKRYEGAGGLSANSQGKLVSTISAGIDSPVASYRMMRRGARIIFVHFHGYVYTGKEEMTQAQELVKILSEYQFDTKLYLIPFCWIQSAIAENSNVPEKIRTVLYRRMMLRIAEKISKIEKAKGLVTGDNFGQVASQTPENLFTVHEATSIPLYQPLIGMDKEEIIQMARDIGTFEISKLPCTDSCTIFAPEHPELKSNVYDVKEYEKSLPIDVWTEKALEKAEIVTY